MDMTSAFQAIVAVFSGVTFIMLAIEKIFGGGHSLASKFATLEKNTAADMAVLRTELHRKVEEHEDNYIVGSDAIKANIHAMQIGLLEFRAKMAEDYINKRDYIAGIVDIRSDVRTGFDEIKKRLDRIEGTMMHRDEG